ncbi:MAG TPA: ATP-grasp domain-containing protein [Methanobacteriaceae archaeon]|nr:ATP-grasp domain-containing protein [Methanobacteriaceae archaeon]HNS25190.1 ATP-grasp domain-containing protein [Methanobacteriaceae archaeon]
MKLLIIEYAMASGNEDPSIAIEGRTMLQGLLEDFNNENTSYLISYHSLPLDGGRCHAKKIFDDVEEWLKEDLSHYDACLPIAPEEDFILYRITRAIEEQGLKVIGSLSKGVLTCSDKWETYQALKKVSPLISTDRIFFEDLDGNSKHVKAIPDFEKLKVAKPVDGVSCSGIRLVDSQRKLEEAAIQIRKNSSFPFFLLQDYIEGDSCSVSLLTDGRNAMPISLNLQNIKINDSYLNYNGGKTPLEHPLKCEAFAVAKKAVESIRGLCGYVGVDLILGDQVHLVEVNSRLTTPYIALRKLVNFNLGQAVMDAAQGTLPSTIQLEGNAYFSKNNHEMNVSVIK